MTNTDISILFKPVTLKAFGGTRGYWANYGEIEKAGLKSLEVTPSLHAQWIGPDFLSVKLDLVFDEKAFPEDRFGMVYGDGEFETSVQEFMAQTFPSEEFGTPCYTEQGMQGDDYVSMEYGDQFAQGLMSSSAHFRLELRHDPLIESLDLGDHG